MTYNENKTPKTQTKLAQFDPLGWTRIQFESALWMINGMNDGIVKDGIKRMLQTGTDYNNLFEAEMCGVVPDLFDMTTIEYLDMMDTICKSDLKFKNIHLSVPIIPTVANLLDSVPELKYGTGANKDRTSADIVLALIAIRYHLPGIAKLPKTYDTLSVYNIQGWLFYSKVLYPEKKAVCSYTGKSGNTGIFETDQGKAIVDYEYAKTNKWSRASQIMINSASAVGMPTLTTCPTCLLTRAARGEEDDTPNFPVTARVLDRYEAFSTKSIGLPIDTTKQVLASCYLHVRATKAGGFKKTYRLHCPSCMTLAKRHPKIYHRMLKEMSRPINKVITRDDLLAWTQEFNDSDPMPLELTRTPVLEPLSGAASRNLLSPAKDEPLTRAAVCRIAEANHALMGELLASVFTFKTIKGGATKATLAKGKTIAMAIKLFNAFGVDVDV